MKQSWTRRPGAAIFLIISYATWAAVSFRWLTVYIEQGLPRTWAIAASLLLFALLLGLEPLLTGRSAMRAHLYLAFQAGLVFAASLLHYELDFFALLYIPLAGQAMYLLPRRAGLIWLAILVTLNVAGQIVQFGWPEALSFALLYSAGLIFVAAFVSMTLEADRARRRSEQLLAELQEAHGRLQALAGQAEELAIANERNRLARDLHDSVAQTLYGLTLQAEAASRHLEAGRAEAVQANLADIRQDAQQTLQETRLLIFELRPAILEEQGLVAALRQRLESVEARGGLVMHIDLPQAVTLPPAVETGLYRIALEALNNVAKHAQASELWLALRPGRQQISLEVTDNGRGFDPAAVGQGRLGLQGMSERVAQLNGRLAVRSAPGAGTTILVEVPQ